MLENSKRKLSNFGYSIHLLRIKNLALIFVAFFFLLPFYLCAQNSGYRFTSISTKNGLSNNLINCITQDSYGYMWFGTDEGLNRYDGYENKIFKRKHFDSTSLSDNHIICLFVDSKKRLWVGSLNGLNLYNPDKEIFKHYLPSKSIALSNTVNRITGIREDSKSNIYVITEAGVLYILKNESLIPLNNFHENGNIKDFIIDNSGNFWICMQEGVLFYNTITKQRIPITSFQQNGLKKKFTLTQTILEDNDNVWIGSNSGQLGYVSKKTLTAEVVNFDKNYFNNLLYIYKDQQGLLHIATNEGLFVLNNQKKLINIYDYQKNNSDGIANNAIYSIYKDVQGNLWLGTIQGVSYSMNGKAFNNYNFYSQKIKLDITNIQGLNTDSKGNIWLGAFHKGLNIINLKSRYKKLYMPDNNNPYSLGESSVINIFEDSKKNMWVGTYLGYLQRFEPSSESFISYKFNHINNGVKEVKDIRSMIEDRNGNLWFISHGFGLFKFNPTSNQFKYFIHDDNNNFHSLANNWAYQVISQHDSILWIATPAGLSRFNIFTEYFHNYYNNSVDSSSLSNDHINSVFCDSQDNIWVGTFFGLNYYNKASNKFYNFFTENGLPSNQIKSFVEEKPGKIWLATGCGLSCMEYVVDNKTGKPDVKFRNYDRSDNVQDIMFWEHSACKTESGEFIFGGENGIVVFNPEKIIDNKTKPLVYITEFNLFNKKVEIGDYDSLLHHNINKTSKITLKHQQNFISFKYVALNYITSEKNQYAYKMEGFDKTWNYVGSKREATFTNLDPGEYTFKVKASNNDGYWNEQGASIKIIILSPWWVTIWFKGLVALAIIFTGYLIYYLRLSFYKIQEKKLTLMVIERTQALEETTVQLEERQEEINQQNEELFLQRDALFEANNALTSKQEQILEQNNELDNHRNKLESLVEERTKELNIAKEKAEESDKLKSSFLANLSHEIRTPLNAIIGFSGLIIDETIKPDERHTFYQIIQKSSDTLLSLINDVLDFSKIEAGHLHIVKSNFQLQLLFDNLQRIFNLEISKQQHSDKTKNIDFKINVEQSIKQSYLCTDEVRLKQILSNLISNAIKFTHEGEIEVGCRPKPNGMIEFYVKDTGIGIKKENLELIFERFRKIEDDTVNLYRGAGLGLAISLQLVKILGGTMSVESELGKGTIFYFTIPFTHVIEDNDGGYVKTMSKVAPNLANTTILIAEDDEANFSFLERLLIQTQVNILHAINGNEVLNILNNNNDVKLILMDIKMPVMNGFETLHELQKREYPFPIIAQTAYAFSEEVKRIFDAGFNDYISKPIDPKELFGLITKYLK